jgi:predicted nucleic acid-binding Zn ribbon protein
MMVTDGRPLTPFMPSGPNSGRGVHPCLECGEPTKSQGEFCGRDCKTSFHNRRKRRGAELYDLYMAYRHERATVKTLGVWRIMNRMAALFRDEDRRERAGRRSWRRPREVLDERPYLQGVPVRMRAGR